MDLSRGLAMNSSVRRWSVVVGRILINGRIGGRRGFCGVGMLRRRLWRFGMVSFSFFFFSFFLFVSLLVLVGGQC